MSRFIYAYKQAPWRTSRQLVGLFLAALIIVAMVATIYLSVTAKAAIVGREIQNLELEISTNQRINADLETKIATLLSTSEMDRRAQAGGFRPIEPDELEYLVVSGYIPPAPVHLAAVTDPWINTSVIPPQYTQSLFEWFDQRMHSPASTITGPSQ